MIVGIISLYITYRTWRNTKDIAKNLEDYKIKKAYFKEHHNFVAAFETAQLSLSQGGHKYYIVSDLLKVCRKIQAFYDNWDPQYKKVIDKFTKDLDNIPEDKDIDQGTRARLQKALFEIQPMLERIGKLDGIG